MVSNCKDCYCHTNANGQCTHFYITMSNANNAFKNCNRALANSNEEQCVAEKKLSNSVSGDTKENPVSVEID